MTRPPMSPLPLSPALGSSSPWRQPEPIDLTAPPGLLRVVQLQINAVYVYLCMCVCDYSHRAVLSRNRPLYRIPGSLPSSPGH